MLVQKKPVRLQAWQLGAGDAKEAEMIAAGKIKLREDGSYELFSMEALGEKGQIAGPGDYFKVDSAGFPYPNKKAFFEERHVPLGDGWYLQKTQPIPAWTADMPADEVIDFLIRENLLRIHPENPARYFTADLWGTEETAAKDAVVVIHSVERDDEGRITGVDFNFVERTIFDSTYTVLER